MPDPGQPENIFGFKEKYPLQPKVYPKEFLDSLDFSPSQKDNTVLLSELRGFFEKTVVESESLTASISEREGVQVEAKRIQDQSRLTLGLPAARILEKDGQSFFEFSFENDLKIIVRGKTEITPLGSLERLEAYPIEYLLVKGKNENYLDLMSLREKGVLALFSFADASASFTPGRTIRTRGGSTSYPPTLRLGVPVEEKQGVKSWRPQNFKIIYLHELGHAILEGEEKEKPEDERNANAIAMQVARQINRLYPEADFFDLEETARDNEQALRQSYDPLIVTPETPLEQIASNEARVAARSQKYLSKF